MVTPSFGLFLLSIPIIAYMEDALLLSVQCAAVMTHCAWMRVPPQKILALLQLAQLVRPTCHPSSFFAAFTPPTINSGPSIAMPSVAATWFRPQTHCPGLGGFVVGFPQLEEQKPQLPSPPIWTSLESVRVEHHGSVSPGAFPSRVQAL